MYGEMFLSWLPVIPASMLVVFFFVAVNMIYRALTVPPGYERKFDGQCGACGYTLGSLSAQQCPECGADLLKAGVVTRRMFIQLRGSTTMAIAAWSVLVFSIGGTSLAVWGIDVQATNMNTAFNPSYNYIQVITYAPQSDWDEDARELVGQSFKAHIEIAVDSMTQLSTDEFSLVLSLPDDTERTLLIEEDDGWVIEDEDEKRIAQGDAYSIAAIDQLFALSGFDIEDESVQSYANQLSILMDSVFDEGIQGLQNEGAVTLGQVQEGIDEQNWLKSYGYSSRAKPGTGLGMVVLPPLTFDQWSRVLYAFLILAGIYVLGVFGIVLRRRQLLRQGRYNPNTIITDISESETGN